jgi:hypothetical protein
MLHSRRKEFARLYDGHTSLSQPMDRQDSPKCISNKRPGFCPVVDDYKSNLHEGSVFPCSSNDSREKCAILNSPHPNKGNALQSACRQLGMMCEEHSGGC